LLKWNTVFAQSVGGRTVSRDGETIEAVSRHLSSCLSAFDLGSVFLFGAIRTGRFSSALTTLDVFIIDVQGLADFGLKGSVIVDPTRNVSNCKIDGMILAYKANSSELSISKSIPVILPASSG
jgi:hypothetical protein